MVGKAPIGVKQARWGLDEGFLNRDTSTVDTGGALIKMITSRATGTLSLQ
ncbi:MAG: hypothetical protein SGI86_01500 [Deltaproteobacteria bacterium]|nr:hypothetical protein [Deltaproteobacteria bacterium]